MSQPPQPRRVTTWEQLKTEATNLRDFYRRALDVSEDLCVAADMRDEILLSQILNKHRNLKAHPAFKVSEELLVEDAQVIN